MRLNEVICYETLSVFVDEPWVERRIICLSKITLCAERNYKRSPSAQTTYFSSDRFVLFLSVELDADHYAQSTNLDGHPHFVLAKDMVLTLELLKFRKIDFGVSSVD